MAPFIERFTLTATDGIALAAYRCLPAGAVKGIVQIAHGVAEHFGRYTRLATHLAAAGYAVYGNDHRGHGASAGVHGLGQFGQSGFLPVVGDMASLSAVAQQEMPGKPLILLGHSMGSFASQLYLLDYSSNLSGLVLSATAALDLLLAAMMASGGPVGLAKLNAAFEPARTGFDWLSRDEAEVDAYIADPLCGFDVDDATLASIFAAGIHARTDPRLTSVRRNLPILFISGACDPVVGPEQSFAQALSNSYEAQGIGPITHHIYAGGRHEMFNETCRDEVEADLIAWADDVVKTAPAA